MDFFGGKHAPKGGFGRQTKTPWETLFEVVVSNISYFHPYLGKISKVTIFFFKGVETTNNEILFVFSLTFCWKENGKKIMVHGQLITTFPAGWSP